MADIFHGHVMSLKKGFFERENTEQAVDYFLHGLHAALTPGPDLRRRPDRSPERRTFSVLRPRANGSRGNRSRIARSGFLCPGGGYQFAKPLPDSWKVTEHFHQTHHSEILGSNHRLNAGGSHFGAGATEELAIRPALTEAPPSVPRRNDRPRPHRRKSESRGGDWPTFRVASFIGILLVRLIQSNRTRHAA